MKNILKIVLIAVLVILAILLIFGFVLVMDWPWWVGFFVLLFFAGLGVGGVFLRKLMIRRKEQMFVSQVIEQDEARIKAAQGKEKDELSELHNKWKEAVDALRRSHLRKYGNPLYVLPWYMIIGESGSGKTTSLNSAKLSSPFVEVTRTSGISGTKNCDWWFFEQAIILDTAGRYAIPIDEGRDKEEWQKFLNLLLKYRKREPLNGLIVAVSADKLLASTPQTLEEDGKNIRRRLDELMRALGTRFPVYLLVTKCDLIQGMTKFCNSLPEKSLDQPMGFVNQNLSADVNAFLEQAVSNIGERLRNLRLLLLHQPEARSVDPGLLLFPEEFENLKNGLGFFIKGAFQENPYQETPVLRGLYFSSGRQEGTPFSHFLNALGLIGEKEVLPGTSKGLFLHDFFSNILPKDRGLLAPTRKALEWSILTRNLGLTAWIVLGVAICGLLSFSFVKNLRTLRTVSHEFAKPSSLQRDYLSELLNMERFNQAILNIERQNHNWWIPRFGLNESINVENALKDKYCKQFQQGFLSPFDRQLKENLARVTSTAPDEIFGQYISHVVRRLNLLKARLDNEEFEKLKTRPQPAYVSSISRSNQELTPEVRQKFGQLFLYYIHWRSDTAEINKEMDILQSWLKDLLRLKGSNPQWIIAWVNKDGAISPVTLRDFWGGSASAPGETVIEPAFSRKGKEAMDSLLKEIELALNDPTFMERQRMEIDAYYRRNCFEAWQKFASGFSDGSKRLRSKDEWQQAAAKMATDDGAYFAFLNRLTEELEPVVTGENIPVWLQQVYHFQAVKNAGAVGGLVAKTTEEGKKFIDRIKEKLGRKIETSTLESQSAAVRAYQDYQSSLTAIAQGASSRSQIFQLVSQTFSEDTATGKAPFSTGYGAVSRLRSNLTGRLTAEEVFSKLVTGPLDYLFKFARYETACQLQSQWEKEVLAESQGATGPQALEILLGQEGVVWKFAKGPAAPFIEWKVQRGYYAKEVFGGVVPFETPFFSLLTGGAKAKASSMTQQQQPQNYKVQIAAQPTDANSDAAIKPHKSQLELTCTGGMQGIVNLNYPISKTFYWSPSTCSGVTLKIDVGNVSLMKEYPGFVEFLRDFPGGHRTFNSGEFPEDAASLRKIGIKFIRVNYQFSGDQAILKTTESLPGYGQAQAPRVIATCWDQ